MAYIIGIGGVSRSGKSSFAEKLRALFGHIKVLHLDLDEFVFAESDIPKINGHPNWEVPESTDYQRVTETIEQNEPSYDLIIVEGILAFANEALTSLYDFQILMEISKATYLKRRKKETRWGKDPEWYIEYVWEAYQKYGQYPEADLTLSGEIPVPQADLKRIREKILGQIR